MSLRITCAWILAGLLCLTKAQAQTPVDSLHRQLPLLSRTDKVSAYNALGWAYKSSYPDSLLHYAELALQLAQELDDRAGEALSYNRLGWGWYLTSEGIRALDALHQAYQIAETHAIVLEQARACINLGIVHKGQGNYDRAIRYHQQALRLSKELSRQDWITMCHNNLGIAYRQQGRLGEALEHYLTSLYMARQFAPMEIPKTYQNLGNLYFEWDSLSKASLYYGRALYQYRELDQPLRVLACLNNLGLVALAQDNYVRADSIFKAGIKLARSWESVSHQFKMQSNLALVYEQQGLLLKALHIHEKSSSYWQTQNNWEAVGRSWMRMAMLANKLNQPKDALEKLNMAKQLADSLQLVPLRYHIYQALVEVYEALKQYKIALDYNKKAQILADTLHQWEMDEESYQHLLRFEAEQREHGWELDRKETQLQASENGRKIWFGVAAITLVLLLAGLSGFWLYRYRQRLHKLQEFEQVREEERKIIGRYLHDSTGVVFSVANIYLERAEKATGATAPAQEELAQARKLVLKAGEMVRYASHSLDEGGFSEQGLEASLNRLVTHIKEVSTLKVIANFIGEANLLDTRTSIFTFHAAKELLNNVLKHAQAQQLYLMVMVISGQVKLLVEDDGQGIDQEEDDFKSGIGLNTLKQQAKARGGSFTIKTAPGKTVITLEYPAQTPKDAVL